MRSSFFWHVTQRIGKVSTYVSVQTTFPIFKGKTVFCLIYGDGPDRLSRSFGKYQSTGKIHPRTCRESPEREQRYNTTLSLTSALDGVGGQRHAPAALPLGKTPVTRCTGGWASAQDWFGRVRKILPPPGLDPRNVQPAASRCTD